MANNRLKTYPLTGGEDTQSAALVVPDGMARILYNYQQDYNSGYSRINGYRPLVNDTLPGTGPVRGLKIYNNKVYLFRDTTDDADGTPGVLQGGIWSATPAEWRIGSEQDGDGVGQRGMNLIVDSNNGSWTRIATVLPPRTDVFNATSPVPSNVTLEPGGFYEFVIANFSATVGDTGDYKGSYYAATTTDSQFYYGDTISDEGVGDLGVTPLFGGDIGDVYLCILNHTGTSTPTTANWVQIQREPSTVTSSHDISDSAGYLYGVDGVNKPFMFDPSIDTYTQIDTTYEVKPHHIEATGNRLCIGFRSGEIAISSSVSPLDFNPVHGAGSIGVQDLLTDLVAGPDGSLYVFCKDKTNLIQGLEGSLTTSSMKAHSKSVGSYPYTAKVLSGHTFFYDTWGMTELQVSDKFGDVVTNSLSSKVQSVLHNNQPIMSVASKGAAQYKTWFRSPTNNYTSVILNSTIIESGIGYAHSVYPFTIDFADIDNIQDSFASWSFGSVDEVHVAGVTEEDGTVQVYHMDVGNNFNGKKYTSYMTLPFNFLESPHQIKRFRKMMLNIESTTEVTLRYTVDFAYGVKSTPKESSVVYLNPNGASWNDALWGDFYWGGGASSYLEGYVNGYGENASVTLFTESNQQAPHIIKDLSWVYQYQRIEH